MVIRLLSTALDRFLFQPESSKGFRLMRKAWAATVLILMLPLAPEVLALFGRYAGVPQAEYVHPYRASLLLLSDDPRFVIALYAALIFSCLCVLGRVRTRFMMVVAFVLYASFVEKNVIRFHSEVQVLLEIGFLLTIWSLFFRSGPVLPAWLHRLLLWQVVVIYVTAFWYKLSSPNWVNGEETALVLLYATFDTNLTSVIAKTFATSLVFVTYAILVGEGSWILMLIPGRLESAAGFPKMYTDVRRTLLFLGFLMHVLWGLLLKMVYPLTLAMLTAYCGLLTEEDFTILRFRRKR